MALGLHNEEVFLTAAHDEWTALYSDEERRLQQAIGDWILEIQHVGSTSIRGVQAKPILDIAVAVTDFELAIACLPLMESLGYAYKGKYGIPRRHYFVKGEPRTHHVHMLKKDSKDWHDTILFRDYLRLNPDSAALYSRRKKELASRYPGMREEYQAAKGAIVEELLERATQDSVK